MQDSCFLTLCDQDSQQAPVYMTDKEAAVKYCYALHYLLIACQAILLLLSLSKHLLSPVYIPKWSTFDDN